MSGALEYMKYRQPPSVGHDTWCVDSINPNEA